MKNAYQVIVKAHQGAEKSKTYDVPDPGSWWGALKIKALPGARYQLVDKTTGQGPDNIRVKRKGNDLAISFEGRSDADLVISGYYEYAEPGWGAVIGETDPGVYYAYIPESGESIALVGSLPDGASNVGMALGGEQIVGSGAAVGALVGAVGFNPLLTAPLALVGAAAGGGGGGGSADTTPPNRPAAKLHAEDDTGVSHSDGFTADSTPRLLIDADPDATEVTVKLNSKTYTSTTKNPQGQFVVQVPDADALGNGVYAYTVVVKDAAGNASLPFDGSLTVDRSADQNYQPTPVNETNTGTSLHISGISTDTGFSQQDLVTSDNTLSFFGTLSGYSASAQNAVELRLLNSDGAVVASQYVLPVNATGAWRWSWDNTSQKLPDGRYQLTAQLVDKAGNAVGTAAAPQTLTVDTNANADANAGFAVAVTQLVQDSGVSSTDFLTKETHLSFMGNIGNTNTGFTGKVLVQIFGTDGVVKSQAYVDPNVNGIWSYDNTAETLGVVGQHTQYVLKASVVDLAGNVLKATDQSFTVDLKAPLFNVSGSASFNDNTTLRYSSMTLRAGTSAAVFSDAEAGTFSFQDQSGNVINAPGPTDDGSLLTYDVGQLKIVYTDLAGNSYAMVNDKKWEFELTDPIVKTSPSTNVPPSAFGGGELAGSVGLYTLSTNETSLDLSTLHSTSPGAGSVGAINHIGLSGSGTVTNAAHTLALTTSDVLALSVKNSFISNGHQQMRIDGDAGDQVMLDDLLGGSTFTWQKAANPSVLSGQNYTVYSNSTLGLDLFIHQTVHVTVL